MTWTLAEDTPWAARGHEVAWAQFDLPVVPAAAPAVRLDTLPALRVAESGPNLQIRGEDFALTFDARRGILTDWAYQGVPLLTRGPQLNVWRAPTDNDVALARKWRQAGLDRLVSRTTSTAWEQPAPQKVQVTVQATLAADCFAARLRRYLSATPIYGSGDVLLETHVVPLGTLPSLPRLGVQLHSTGRLRPLRLVRAGATRELPGSP